MIRELFLGDVSLSNFVWQSMIFIMVGLVSSFILRHRSSRAHQVLFLAMIAAVIVPILSILVKHYELGMFVAEPVVIQPQSEDSATANNYEASGLFSAENIEHKPAPIEETAVLAMPGSQSTKFSWHSVLLSGWIATSLILAARLLATFILGVRLLSHAPPLDCKRIQEAAHLARAKLGIAKDVRVCSSDDVRSPVIWCWRRRPVLLVPSAAERFDNRIDWAGVFSHELAHWKRRDHISGLLAELVVCLFPWNPLLWLAKSRLVRLSEQACDDWVLATGQPGTDYAESLLDLTPGGQMAFVPAVVTSKKTLAGRVRRILEEKCASPHTGLRWSLAAAVVTGCIGVGIAFAQTRPSHPTGTVKIKAGRLASIEQLASATTIKGRILDPNNEPAYLARIVALPMTSYGAEIHLDNKEGYFELPWSPTWIVEGQAICLMARGRYDRNEAAFVEVPDLTSPVTIHLEPGVTLTGKVIDPNGRPIDATVVTSLAKPFRCRAPIRYDTTHPHHIDKSRQGRFTFSMLPYNQTYKLNIRAEGYQPTELTVDTKDTSKDNIDIGAIAMQPQDPAKPAIAEEPPNPDLMKEFYKVYRVDEGEVIKFIKPPFPLGRQEYLTTMQNFLTWDHFKVFFHWDGEPKPHAAFTGSSRLNPVLRYALRMSVYDFNLPKELDVCLPHGDWVVRDESSLQEQLRALEEIIYSESHKSIRFEKRTAEREVIVATGRYEFKPHPSGDYPNRVHVTWDGKLEGGGGKVDSLAKLFRHLERDIEIKIVDETEPIENATIRYRQSSKLSRIPADPEHRSERLSALLDNLAKTTSLQFTVERRPAEVWLVTEDTKNGSSRWPNMDIRTMISALEL